MSQHVSPIAANIAEWFRENATERARLADENAALRAQLAAVEPALAAAVEMAKQAVPNGRCLICATRYAHLSDCPVAAFLATQERAK